MTIPMLNLSSNTKTCETLHRVVLTNNLTGKLQSNGMNYSLRLFVMRIADIATVVGPLIFLVVTVVLESIQPGYDRMRETISDLVWGQHGWCQTAVFYLFAFVLASLALRLYLFGNGRKGFQFGSSLIALMSVGFIIIAVFPTKAPGALVTLTVSIHRYTAGMICFLFPLICLSIAIALRGNSCWSKVRIFTIASGGLGVVLCILGTLVIMTASSWKGALERMMVANGILWIEVVGIWSLSNLRHPFIGEEVRINEYLEDQEHN